MHNLKVLFLGKQNDAHCQRAADFVRLTCSDVSIHLGKWGDKLPPETKEWQGDYIISYLSRWVVPAWLLSRAAKAAINFHPATPDYPGIGCNNFALYDGADQYGATCHHMAPKVDTGKIIAVKRFRVFPNDSVATILTRTYDFQLALFYEVVSEMVVVGQLPESSEVWTREPYSRKEFDQLGIIEPTMSQEEIDRRVRATSYGIYQPIIKVGGYEFKLNP